MKKFRITEEQFDALVDKFMDNFGFVIKVIQFCATTMGISVPLLVFFKQTPAWIFMLIGLAGGFLLWKLRDWVEEYWIDRNVGQERKIWARQFNDLNNRMKNKDN